ncbi:MAG: hypothetical protein QG671_2806 [Actinomycetota bacterium]|nr:hypothetical protein [Actinomycetota bacterium]
MTPPNRARPRPRPLTRRVGRQNMRRTVVVVCEGTTTEPLYFDALRLEREVQDVAAVQLRVQRSNRGKQPLALVQKAIDIKAEDNAAGREIDEIWCVFDVEWPQNHPKLQETLTLAERNNISIAVSNPCFELWLILHFKSQAAFLTTNEACRLRGKLDKSRGKGLNPDLYMPRRNSALQNARLLDQRHADDETSFPHDNPSSGMYRLLAAVSSCRPS